MTAARFPARKTLEELDFDHQRSLKRDVISHPGALDFVDLRENGVFLGAPGTGKTPSPSASPSEPATPVTQSRSPAGSTTSSAASAATPSWSSTKSATSPSRPTPPTCSSSSFLPLRTSQPRRRRRRHDRPARPPRRSRLPQKATATTGSIFGCRQLPRRKTRIHRSVSRQSARADRARSGATAAACVEATGGGRWGCHTPGVE